MCCEIGGRQEMDGIYCLIVLGLFVVTGLLIKLFEKV
jgi:hypothetical protein